jgi:hypothetical protein
VAFIAPQLLPETVIPSLPQIVSSLALKGPKAEFQLNRSVFLLFLP